MATSPSTTAFKRLGDRYEIVQPIGHPFGYQQFLAQDMYHQRSVVIKSLALEENTPTGDICCFEREIHLLESLRHPTIPQYIDSFTVDTPVQSGTNEQHSAQKGLVLVQNHHGGTTLAQQINAGRICSEAEIKVIAKQLLQGLIYLHSQGLVHRDIKPESIVLANADGSDLESDSWQASWLNLGTVQYVQAQRNDALVGTYGYMPPEQVGGQATFASDLYSLGATLIYLATGRHLGELPYRPDSGSLRVRFACSPSQLSPRFQQWLNWMIEPYVGDRPASARQALKALNHLPIAMLKRQLLAPTRAHMLPIPITNGSRDKYEPFFTQIKSVKKIRSFELIIPPIGLHTAQAKLILPPLIMGVTLLVVALHLLSLLRFSPAMLTTTSGLIEGVASIAAASLAFVGCLYSSKFLANAFRLANRFMLRQIHIQLEADVLLIAYKSLFRAPEYVVNTRRADIYSICELPAQGTEASTLRILTHHNRTRKPYDCYKLSLTDGALSHRDIRWLTSLINDWRHQPGSCTLR
ncbi:MAG: serine/threonine-protein kinase [Cyanobacteria bacterium P01_D01_bin.105]